MKKPVILIVEDEESLVSFIAEELKYENYEVLIAADGQEALTLFDVNEEKGQFAAAGLDAAKGRWIDCCTKKFVDVVKSLS